MGNTKHWVIIVTASTDGIHLIHNKAREIFGEKIPLSPLVEGLTEHLTTFMVAPSGHRMNSPHYFELRTLRQEFIEWLRSIELSERSSYGSPAWFEVSYGHTEMDEYPEIHTHHLDWMNS